MGIDNESSTPIEMVQQQKLIAIAAEVDSFRDALGEPVDPGIKDTLVALRAYGFTTSQSCGGHDDRAEALPWVDIETPAPEGWKDDVAKQTAWKAANDAQAGQLMTLLNQWYGERLAAGETMIGQERLSLDPKGIYGAVRLESQAQRAMSRRKLSERREIPTQFRQEMQKFSDYLHDKFIKGE